MVDWNRDTPWRQGQVITNESSLALGVVRPEDAGAALAVVISHDCDLAQSPETEPVVEIIVARRVKAADGNFTHGKNSRRLHLECTIDGAESYLDMRAQGKREIKKSALAGHSPAANVVVKPEDRSILQRWLAARYRRAGLPDEFERRLLGDRHHRLLQFGLRPQTHQPNLASRVRLGQVRRLKESVPGPGIQYGRQHHFVFQSRTVRRADGFQRLQRVRHDTSTNHDLKSHNEFVN